MRQVTLSSIARVSLALGVVTLFGHCTASPPVRNGCAVPNEALPKDCCMPDGELKPELYGISKCSVSPPSAELRSLAAQCGFPDLAGNGPISAAAVAVGQGVVAFQQNLKHIEDLGGDSKTSDFKDLSGAATSQDGTNGPGNAQAPGPNAPGGPDLGSLFGKGAASGGSKGSSAGPQGGASAGLGGSSGSGTGGGTNAAGYTSNGQLNGAENVYGSASGGGGAKGKSGGDSAFSSLSGLFGGLGGSKDGKDGAGNKTNITSFGNRNGANGINPMGSADPEDYFTRINVDDSIFKQVERRYEQTAVRWSLAK